MEPDEPEIMSEALLHEAAQRRLQRRSAVAQPKHEHMLGRSPQYPCSRGGEQTGKIAVAHAVDLTGRASGRFHCLRAFALAFAAAPARFPPIRSRGLRSVLAHLAPPLQSL